MTGTVINLRQARKAKARAAKDQAADENRRRYGRTKADKQAGKAAEAKTAKHLDDHKLSD